MTAFALVDCNNFYVSCERVFNPHLIGKPVVILSNNDGCIVARSNEVKQLGIPMGAPFFQWKELCHKNHVFVFSSNYELYGDLSQRVMSILQQFCPDTEIYSIDEAFLLLDNIPEKDLYRYAKTIRKIILTWTGIPVSIGLAATRTLAKVAGLMAKKHSPDGIFDLRSPETHDRMLDNLPVEDIWGIGRQLSVYLNDMNITTAKALRDSHAPTLRKKHGVMLERVILELRGISCQPLDAHTPRKQIISSRSFGRPVTALHELEEAVSHYVALAGKKLRNQASLAHALNVFIYTNYFNKNKKQYSKNITLTFSTPVSSTPELITAAKCGLRKIFMPGYQYKKAGIMLLDLTPETCQQQDLFNPATDSKMQKLTQTADYINQKMGKSAMYFCAEGIKRPWKNRNDRRTPSYTTRWDELVKVYCN